MEKLPAGNNVFDNLLGGGFEKDIITTIYGPSGSGKTNICLIAAINVINSGKKVIYVDSEGGISAERLGQLSKGSSKVLDNCLFLRPMSFEEQKNVFERLRSMVDDKIGLIIVDTLTMLYRVERGQSYNHYEIDSDLGKQIQLLSEISRRHNIPVIVANQVYDSFNGEGVKMVGGNLLQYSSKCLIELKKGQKGKRIAVLKKHRSLGEGKECMFEIVDDGITA